MLHAMQIRKSCLPASALSPEALKKEVARGVEWPVSVQHYRWALCRRDMVLPEDVILMSRMTPKLLGVDRAYLLERLYSIQR